MNYSVLFISLDQISSSAQSGQSSLFRRGRQHKVQRPDPCREQQLDRKTIRNLRLAGGVATLFFFSLTISLYVKCPLSVCVCPTSCTCPRARAVISLNSCRNSAFCIRRLLWCFCVSPYCPHDVLSLSVHLNAFSPRRSCDTATVMQKERDERLMTPLAGGKAVFLRPGPDLWRISLCRRPPGIQATALSHTCYVRRRRADAPCKMYFSAGYVLEGAAEAGQPIKLSY